MAPTNRRFKTFQRSRHGALVVGDVQYGKQGSFGPRRQRDFQLVVLHSGSLRLTLDGSVIDVPEHYAILLTPDHRESFAFADDRETRHSWIALDADTVGEELGKEFEQYRGPAPFLGNMAKLLDLIRCPLAKPAFDGPLQTKCYEAIAHAIFFAFTSAVKDRSGVSTARDSALWRMERFISEAYQRPLLLDDIARNAAVSRQHLLKLCRLAGMETPMNLLYRKRLEAAAELLLHTGFSMGAIAEQSGFANQFHFSRKFKQCFGSSPKLWRVRSWRQEEHLSLGYATGGARQAPADESDVGRWLRTSGRTPK
jgi:AraC-like DNA-binding protein